jgi:hypothetical protein
MNMEEILRSALENEASRPTLPSGLFSVVVHRTRIRRAVNLSLIGLTAASVSIAGFAGVRAFSRGSPHSVPGASSSSTLSTTAASATVPQVVGLSESSAVKTLAQAGLVAEIHYDRQARQAALVLDSDPAAGAVSSISSSVTLRIAVGPAGPIPGPGEEELNRPLSSLVEDNPGAFVGLYLDASSVPVVVFNPRIDVDAWRARLDAAAEGRPYSTDSCLRSGEELGQVQDELGLRQWSPRAGSISFGVWVDPATCTVRVETDQLTESDIQALIQRFGTAVSLNTSKGSSPERL